MAEHRQRAGSKPGCGSAQGIGGAWWFVEWNEGSAATAGAVALPTVDGGSRGMVGMVGLQLLDGQIGLRVASASDVVADFLKLRKVVQDGGDGTGELVKGDLV